MRVNYRGILNLEKVGFYYLGNLPQVNVKCFITFAQNAMVLFSFWIQEDCNRNEKSHASMNLKTPCCEIKIAVY
jgi:hypothetical protein